MLIQSKKIDRRYYRENKGQTLPMSIYIHHREQCPTLHSIYIDMHITLHIDTNSHKLVKQVGHTLVCTGHYRQP